MDSVENTIDEEDPLEKDFDPLKHTFNEIDCLHSILTYSKLKEPNWLELSNFVHFLNSQLYLCEQATILTEFKLLKNLCVQLVTLMANDFGLPSLNMRNENRTNNAAHIDLDAMTISESRRWENMVHPYIIFHSCGQSLCFLGTILDRKERRFVNPNTLEFIENDITIPEFSKDMFMTLLTQRLKIFDNFNTLIREVKLMSLSYVMGLDVNNTILLQKDKSYELTLDNCLKMMAIYLRYVLSNI